MVQRPAPIPVNTWTHLAATYDGIWLRLYVNGIQAASRAVFGALVSSSGVLTIGGNGIWNDEWLAGTIDEVRVYARALSAAEIQADMTQPVVPSPLPDTQAPSTPTGFDVTSSTGNSITTAWDPSTDDVGVTGYEVFRDGTSAGLTDAAPTTFVFAGLSCGTSYLLEVQAIDAAGNRSGKAEQTASTAACPPPGTANVYVARDGSDGILHGGRTVCLVQPRLRRGEARRHRRGRLRVLRRADDQPHPEDNGARCRHPAGPRRLGDPLEREHRPRVAPRAAQLPGDVVDVQPCQGAQWITYRAGQDGSSSSARRTT